MVPFDRLVWTIGERLAEAGCVPLLVFRAPEFEEIAWREGRRAARAAEQLTISAFRASAKRILRADDGWSHPGGSDRFVVAMLAPGRHGKGPEAPHVRTTLARVAAAMSLATGRRIESGWWPVQARTELDSPRATLDAALERGLRERTARCWPPSDTSCALR